MEIKTCEQYVLDQLEQALAERDWLRGKLLEGWHCSCYDWPEVDWDATHYEEDELLKIADMRKRNPSDNAERRFFMLVEQALGAHQ